MRLCTQMSAFCAPCRRAGARASGGGHCAPAAGRAGGGKPASGGTEACSASAPGKQRGVSAGAAVTAGVAAVAGDVRAAAGSGRGWGRGVCCWCRLCCSWRLCCPSRLLWLGPCFWSRIVLKAVEVCYWSRLMWDVGCGRWRQVLLIVADGWWVYDSLPRVKRRAHIHCQWQGLAISWLGKDSLWCTGRYPVQPEPGPDGRLGGLFGGW